MGHYKSFKDQINGPPTLTTLMSIIDRGAKLQSAQQQSTGHLWLQYTYFTQMSVSLNTALIISDSGALEHTSPLFLPPQMPSEGWTGQDPTLLSVVVIGRLAQM